MGTQGSVGYDANVSPVLIYDDAILTQLASSKRTGTCILDPRRCRGTTHVRRNAVDIRIPSCLNGKPGAKTKAKDSSTTGGL